ncbi:MAG: (2Fe-2S)-binding protein [Marinicella sp.]
MLIELVINEKTHVVDVPAEMPLLWVLRDVIKQTGTKYGCGKGLCGACTVHIDGLAQRSCLLQVVTLKGKKITTIEGLSQGELHPVQKAWIQADVPQCGFCQAGQMMQAASIFNQNSRPTTAEIERSMEGNLCRCGTYTRVRTALNLAAKHYQGKQS